MSIHKLILPVCILSIGLPNLFAVSESEAVNKTLWLNTGGHRGALPGKQPKNPEPLRYQYDDSIWDDFDESEYVTGRLNKWEFSIENGIFTARALEDSTKGEFARGGDSADLFGVYSEFLLHQNTFSSIAPEYFLRFAYAGGDCSLPDGDVADVGFAEISLGANLRWKVCDFLAFSVGGRAGVGAIVMSNGYDAGGDRGFVYGGGAKIEWIINKNNSLVLSCDYLACTAEVEIEGLEVYGIEETEKQSWTTFQLGWKYTF